jgi:hypothetical protein
MCYQPQPFGGPGYESESVLGQINKRMLRSISASKERADTLSKTLVNKLPGRFIPVSRVSECATWLLDVLVGTFNIVINHLAVPEVVLREPRFMSTGTSGLKSFSWIPKAFDKLSK